MARTSTFTDADRAIMAEEIAAARMPKHSLSSIKAHACYRGLTMRPQFPQAKPLVPAPERAESPRPARAGAHIPDFLRDLAHWSTT